MSDHEQRPDMFHPDGTPKSGAEWLADYLGEDRGEMTRLRDQVLGALDADFERARSAVDEQDPSGVYTTRPDY